MFSHFLRIGRLCAAMLVFLCTAGALRAAAPAAPGGLVCGALNPGGVSFLLNDDSTDEAGFTIDYKLTSSSTWVANNWDTGAPNTGSLLSFSISIPANLSIDFRVRAYNGSPRVYSGYSNIATVVTGSFGAPASLIATSLNACDFALRWVDNATTETGFVVEYSVGSGAPAWQTFDGTRSADQIYFAPIGGIPGMTYQARVKAVKTGAETAYSNIATVTLPLDAPPAGLTATVVDDYNVRLNWTNQSLCANEYQIEAQVTGDPGFTVVSTVAATQAVAGIGVAPGRSYKFRLQAVVSVGDSAVAISPYSAEATATTLDNFTGKTYATITPGEPFAYQATTSTASARTNLTATGLPPGVSPIDPVSGLITGTPTVPGLYPVTLTATFADGHVATQTLPLRVAWLKSPPVIGAVIPQWTATPGQTRDTTLTGTFTDPEVESAVRVSTNVGDMDFILYNSLTPLTVTNFMNYVNRGDYGGAIFHRSAKFPNGTSFVIQGGGFKGVQNPDKFAPIPTDQGVTNEPGIANLRGTISMAKADNQPDSGTNQFFVSLNDNRQILDDQNGGFTVFGRVTTPGMVVAEAIAAKPRGNYTVQMQGAGPSGVTYAASDFADLPFNDTSAPGNSASIDQAKLITINSVTPITTYLTHAVTGNTNPSVATASLAGGALHLTSLAGGATTVTVTATDLDGDTTSQQVAVTVNDTYATWAGRKGFADTATGAGNPDGDGLKNLLEYALMGDPLVPDSGAVLPVAGKTSASSPSLTLTFPARKFAQGLRYTVEAAGDVSLPWTAVWTSSDGLTTANARVVSSTEQADRTVVTIQDTVAMSAGSRRYLRLRVEQL